MVSSPFGSVFLEPSMERVQQIEQQTVLSLSCLPVVVNKDQIKIGVKRQFVAGQFSQGYDREFRSPGLGILLQRLRHRLMYTGFCQLRHQRTALKASGVEQLALCNLEFFPSLENA